MNRENEMRSIDDCVNGDKSINFEVLQELDLYPLIDFTENQITELIELFGIDEFEVFADEILVGKEDFYVGRTRVIHEAAIDKIMQDELVSDMYVLGGCTPSFIFECIDMDFDIIEEAQKHENYVVLGLLLAKDIKAVQQKMVSWDGYGQHFNPYNGGDKLINKYYIFH